MSDSSIILDTAAKGLGDLDASTISVRKFSSADDSSHVGVFAVVDHPERGVTSWGTVGMSFFDNGVSTRDDRALTVELVAAAGSSWTIVGDGLARCALLVADGQSCTPNSVFRDAFKSASDPVTTPHAVFIAPFLWSRFTAIELDDLVVTWLQAVPVTEAEAAYALERGVDALTTVWEREQPDLYDLSRASTV